MAGSVKVNTNNFLTLIPTAHRVATISDLQTSDTNAVVGEESAIIPSIQKTRRSSSTATADSNTAAEEPSLTQVNSSSPVVEAPVTDVSVRKFLKLGN
ncbi:hypothetical protein HRR83_002662 [Exophiala dermatitidis]|uniref:Uncharacterized protein n=2 Tax=Exophiala dermatitidis TaxID=5970 RepID=H6C018_EXODN